MLRTFPRYPLCPVCGDPAENPATLDVQWWWDPETRRVMGRFTPQEHHAGYPGRMHGGLLAALVDECLAWVGAVSRRGFCMTGELSLRFRRPAATGSEVTVTGWLQESWGPYVRGRAEVHDPERRLLATAVGTFAAMAPEETRRLWHALHRRPEDLDIVAGA